MASGEYGNRQRGDGNGQFRVTGLLKIAVAGLVNAGVRALQHLDADEEDEYSPGDAERRQGDAEQLEEQFPDDGNDHNDDKRQQECIARHLPLCGGVVSGGESEENRGVHDGEEAHEHRCRVR